MRGMRLGLVTITAVASLAPFGATPSAAQVDASAVYERWCAGCHGQDGTGDGAGAGTMMPRPRDFTLALYQVRSTLSGELPTDDDILQVIDVGMPGTAMPGWRDVLTRDERLALVDYLKGFSRFFDGPAPTELTFGKAPRVSDESLEAGRAAYELIECFKCHGDDGRGSGTSAPTLNDDYGFPIAAADLTQNWRFNGGGTVEDIYRRLRTGLDGTPMPGFSDLIDAGVITDDDLWSLAHYVRSLAPETPEVREVIVAELLEDGELPSTVDDELWNDVESYYVPMVGQIVLSPRWFNPRVSTLWVQAVHNGNELVMLVSWTDPSMSPDPEWTEYADQVIASMTTRDPGSATGPGPGDQLAVQFPQAPMQGMERPFFLQGDSRRPAYLWSWSSVDGANEKVARGMGTAQTQTSQDLSVVPVHDEGQWKILLRRSLMTEDSEDLQFPIGSAVPIAFQVWDGDNGEQGFQGAISTWYFLLLEQATPISVYVIPVVAMILTFGLGTLIVAQARKKEQQERAA